MVRYPTLHLHIGR